MFKNFFMKKMVQSQLKNVPKDQQDQIMQIVENNPELFTTIAKEVEHKMKKEGKPQQAAMMEVMKAHQDELRKALGQ